ncbi:rhomboid family intramembrane serine protease [Stieleria varia]|uniref:Intramembrane serine protease GlpG n=1 Tax=Stieleria varia TaxID=2528005 RepID=A0A5C6ANN9_9BACT|nr:rhomboid family intramembrane serine protease [Stieleria varia]TWU00869.1 intramembrane serine protease GlpG [Stieleria varia]
MLLPYGTDAPLYHYPVTTVVCILINVAMFLVTGMGQSFGFCPLLTESDFRYLALEFDQINPIQWVTAAFMHASWMHLVGNMVFLWCFGIVVEGKIGALKFAGLYLCIALADGAIGQIPMYFISGEGCALGASGVIFALMAVALIWAPENDIHCVFWWRYLYTRQVDLPIYAFAGFYFALQLIPLAIFGVRMSSELLHLMGMSVGFPFAIVMLRRGWVDCEGWDLFSRYHDRTKGSSKKLETILGEARERASGQQALNLIRSNPAAFNPPAQATAAAKQWTPEVAPCDVEFEFQFCWALDASDLDGAQRNYDELVRLDRTGEIDIATLVKFVDLLASHKRYRDSLAPLSILARRRGTIGHLAALRMAKIYLRVLRDSKAAQRVLSEMRAPWAPKINQKRNQIILQIQSTGYTDQPT